MMSDELAGFGAPSWLPPRAVMAQAAEDAAERAADRAAEVARAERHEVAHERALGSYRTAAEGRGEFVSALAMARGDEVGRGLPAIFADVLAAADREDGREIARKRREDVDTCRLDAVAEPVLHGASRSAWPGSEFELSRMIDQASDLHRWGVMYQARHNYPAALDEARAKQAYL